MSSGREGWQTPQHAGYGRAARLVAEGLDAHVRDHKAAKTTNNDNGLKMILINARANKLVY
jgi:hypothetical protein